MPVVKSKLHPVIQAGQILEILHMACFRIHTNMHSVMFAVMQLDCWTFQGLRRHLLDEGNCEWDIQKS